MKLLRLRLENFRQHSDTDLHFESGMTAIIGPNGSGKSTLVEAIGFALYGEQRDKKETLRFHWGKGRRFAVTLDFEFDGRRFQVERTHSDAHLTQMGDKEVVRAHGLTETTRACERLLHLGYDQFVNSFCAEQKQLAFLQFRTNAARQEEVARMLGFDRLRLAEDLAVQRRRDAAVQREALERTRVPADILQIQHREAKQALDDAKRSLKLASKEAQRLDAEALRASETRRQAERWLALTRELETFDAEIAGLQRLWEAAQEALASAMRDAEEYENLAEPASAYREAEVRMRQLEPLRLAAAQAEGLRSQIAELCQELAAIPQSDVALLTSQVTDVEAMLNGLSDEWNRDRGRLDTALGAATVRVEAAMESLARAEEGAKTGICPECGQPIADAESRLDKARQTRDAAISDLSALREQQQRVIRKPDEIEQLESRLREAGGRLAAAREQQRKCQTLEARRGDLDRRLQNLPDLSTLAETEALRQTMAVRRPAFERSLALAESPQRLQAQRIESEKCEQALKAASERRAVLQEDREPFSYQSIEEATAAIARHQSLVEALAKASAERNHVQALLAVAERDLIAVEARLAQQRGLEEEIASLKSTEVLHDTCAREMRTLRQELNTSIGPELSSRASENLGLLTNGRYLALELDRNFAASIVEDGISKPVISGGEEDVVALSLRLALSELIQERQGRPMSLLILDEVFASLDTERRQSVLDRLSALKGRFDQILVITHIEEVQQVADQTVHLQRDPATRSTTLIDQPPL